jgi:hypothetical protein
MSPPGSGTRHNDRSDTLNRTTNSVQKQTSIITVGIMLARISFFSN